jgi:hypothetical protein
LLKVAQQARRKSLRSLDLALRRHFNRTAHPWQACPKTRRALLFRVQQAIALDKVPIY